MDTAGEYVQLLKYIRKASDLTEESPSAGSADIAGPPHWPDKVFK